MIQEIKHDCQFVTPDGFFTIDSALVKTSCGNSFAGTCVAHKKVTPRSILKDTSGKTCAYQISTMLNEKISKFVTKKSEAAILSRFQRKNEEKSTELLHSR
jgi:hypothetical protein